MGAQARLNPWLHPRGTGFEAHLCRLRVAAERIVAALAVIVAPIAFALALRAGQGRASRAGCRGVSTELGPV